MHYNPNYDNISEALGHEDGLMVMGFFFFCFMEVPKNSIRRKGKGEATTEFSILYTFKSSPTNLEEVGSQCQR